MVIFHSCVRLPERKLNAINHPHQRFLKLPPNMAPSFGDTTTHPFWDLTVEPDQWIMF
jgi:hypothetical protein